jgi:hypothetical protein
MTKDQNHQWNTTDETKFILMNFILIGDSNAQRSAVQLKKICQMLSGS